jgi:hypothetical protein
LQPITIKQEKTPKPTTSTLKFKRLKIKQNKTRRLQQAITRTTKLKNVKGGKNDKKIKKNGGI